jgi:hypothetical protein
MNSDRLYLRACAQGLSLLLTAVGLFSARPAGGEAKVVSRCESDLKSNLSYHVVYDEGGYVMADRVLPQFDPARRVIVAFYKGHTYIQYKGYRIDSNGLGGIRVKTRLQKSDVLHGEAAAVLYDLSDEALARLDRAVADFKSGSSLSCVRASCRYLKMAEPAALGISPMGPYGLMKALIAYKQRGGKVELVMLNRMPLEYNMEEIEKEERKLRGQLLFLGGFALPMLIPIGHFWISLLLF